MLMLVAFVPTTNAAERRETEQLFYHGFSNYMRHAFPEDELRPVNCTPLTRNALGPDAIEITDPLGNYSLTLVDSLSTLAVLASGNTSEKRRKKALSHFQLGIVALVKLYGDGTQGLSGAGRRARGFDLDSKVQVFETVIRGVGGLLSAHLFAAGDLPIRDYNVTKGAEIRWSDGFIYDGQLLRLADDLARRLLPAFTTSTGIPYPRVNLRHGIPFYLNSPLSCPDSDDHRCSSAQCPATAPGNRENTQTCSAGAGTLLLEFTVLSRLTGDPIFETIAKRAFWAIWDRRSHIGLIGSNIDPETGFWTNPFTGLGAGVDSYFEYAFKAYILLSGAEQPASDMPLDESLAKFYPQPLAEKHHDPDSFLNTWKMSYEAIKRHLHRGKSHIYPHYIQGDLFTGAARALWMDSLSAFFPGLLALSGDVEDAVENHVLFAALWTRYSAMPERWSAATAGVEGGLGWWLGRPEFIESTYHIYRATRDPWFLHVGEMTLRDIQRLCWVPCGLSGLQDVRTGEKNNRMESFFLGETAKYLFLLFDPDHPFNHLDAPFVFSTEGHPLIIPPLARSTPYTEPARSGRQKAAKVDICPKPSQPLPFTVSRTAARPDLFHAASLARLDLKPIMRQSEVRMSQRGSQRPATVVDIRSPSNHSYYPWTLPMELVPFRGMSSVPTRKPTFDITFPSTSNVVFPSGMLQRVENGLLISSMGGLRLSMIQDVSGFYEDEETELYRVHIINSIPLGRDEKLFLPKDTMSSTVDLLDPLFTRVQDLIMLDLVVDLKQPKVPKAAAVNTSAFITLDQMKNMTMQQVSERRLADFPSDAAAQLYSLVQTLSQMSARKEDPVAPRSAAPRRYLSAINADGVGAGLLPDVRDAPHLPPSVDPSDAAVALPWTTVYAAGENCGTAAAVSLPRHVVQSHEVLLLRRGGCSFAEKLENVPRFDPQRPGALRLVVVVSFEASDHGEELTRPLLEFAQRTRGDEAERDVQLPMVLVGGGQAVYDMLAGARAVGLKRRYSVHSNGVPISNLIIV